MLRLERYRRGVRDRLVGVLARVHGIHAAFSLLALVFTAGDGLASEDAEDSRLLPDVQRPPTLPELTHPDGEATIETTTGAMTSSATSPLARGHVPVHTGRLNIEVPLGDRHWFFGATYQMALGAPSSPEPVRLVSGNAEFSGRGVWATTTGLAFGGGAGVMLPIANFDRASENRDVALAAQTLRPWDAPFFDEGFLTFRPFIDVRDVMGPLVMQLRQGLDWQFDVRGSGSSRLLAVTSVYLGYRVSRVIAAGIEAFELYKIDAAVPDDSRLYVTVAPNVRLLFQHVQPSFSVLTNVVNALFPGAARVYSARLGLTFLW